MAIEFINAVYELPRDAVTASELSVLAYLANRANERGVCWPTRSVIADAVRLHEDTVKAVLRSLVAKGYLTKTNRSDGGRILSSEITLHLHDRAPAEVEDEADGGRDAPVEGGDIPPGVGGDIPPARGVEDPPGGGVEDPRGGGSETPGKYINHQEPPIEPSLLVADAPSEQPAKVVEIRDVQARRAMAEDAALKLLVSGAVARQQTGDPAKPGKPGSRKPTAYPELFEQAWRAYPHRKGRSSKPVSFKRWLPLPAEHQEGLPAAATAFAAQPQGSYGAPAMEVWLGQEKFVDWLPATAPSQQAGSFTAAIDWDRRMREWTNNRYWRDDWGPRPGRPGCAAPTMVAEDAAA